MDSYDLRPVRQGKEPDRWNRAQANYYSSGYTTLFSAPHHVPARDEVSSKPSHTRNTEAARSFWLTVPWCRCLAGREGCPRTPATTGGAGGSIKSLCDSRCRFELPSTSATSRYSNASSNIRKRKTAPTRAARGQCRCGGSPRGLILHAPRRERNLRQEAAHLMSCFLFRSLQLEEQKFRLLRSTYRTRFTFGPPGSGM